MSNTKRIESELAARQKNLIDLQAALDAAVDAGDATEVAALQSEINAAQLLVESTQRRLAKAREQQTVEARTEAFNKIQAQATTGMKAAKAREKAGAELEKAIDALAVHVAKIKALNDECASNVWPATKAGYSTGMEAMNRAGPVLPLATGERCEAVAAIRAALERTGILELCKLTEISTQTRAKNIADAYAMATDTLQVHVDRSLAMSKKKLDAANV